MWEDYYGWGGPQQYDWGMDPTGNNFSTYSSYDPITLPTQFWPDQSTYDATTAHMASLGVTNAPRGTLDPNVTSAYGQATYNQPSWMDDPLTPALIMMGGAALGGGFANGGAGYGAGAYGGSATTYPLASSGGSITATPLSGASGGLGGVVADGLSEITVGAQRLPGGLDSLGGGGMWDNIMGGLSGNWGSLIGGLLGAADAHNQPDSMTSTYGPDPALTGAGRDVLARLQALYANGGPGVAGADPASLQAIQGLQGFASGNNINPYLDSVFNSAADSTRNRLTSEFARSGRNIQASAPARSEELQHLAAGIYGQGYENERQRQYGSLLPLLGGGEYMRGINQEQMNQPYNNQLRYSAGLNSLLPLFPGQNTQPLFNNPWAGFLGGAQLGSLFTQG
jgi:hypothetical protein